MDKRAKRPGAEVRRGQILEAAVRVMGGKCYHSATTREIAREAGVSERTLFIHFENKKELYREAVKQAHRELFEALGRSAPPMDDMRTFLKMSERNFLAYLEQHPFKVKLIFQALDVLGDEDLREDVRGTFQSIYRLFYAIVEEGKKRGEINRDVSTLSAVVTILGFHFVVAYVEFMKLDWFDGEEDIYSVVDVFADFVTGRGR